jgi:uncharacterized protein YchJ
MQSAVEYIVVDECYCIVQWYPNFRTDNKHCAIEIGFRTSQYLGIDSYCIEMYAVGSGKDLNMEELHLLSNALTG